MSPSPPKPPEVKLLLLIPRYALHSRLMVGETSIVGSIEFPSRVPVLLMSLPAILFDKSDSELGTTLTRSESPGVGDEAAELRVKRTARSGQRAVQKYMVIADTLIGFVFCFPKIRNSLRESEKQSSLEGGLFLIYPLGQGARHVAVPHHMIGTRSPTRISTNPIPRTCTKVELPIDCDHLSLVKTGC